MIHGEVVSSLLNSETGYYDVRFLRKRDEIWRPTHESHSLPIKWKAFTSDLQSERSLAAPGGTERGLGPIRAGRKHFENSRS
jgi:hypothetical protein